MYQRLTITLPDYTVDQLMRSVSKGNRSSFVAQAVENELIRQRMHKVVDDPLENLTALRSKLPKLTSKQIMNSIEKGRQ